MNWEVEYTQDAQKDMRRLDGSERALVYKALDKVRKDPTEKGYGKPFGHRNDMNLTGLMKIKLRDSGIRVVYKLEIADGIMKIIVVAARTDEQVYKEAAKRRDRYGL